MGVEKCAKPAIPARTDSSKASCAREGGCVTEVSRRWPKVGPSPFKMENGTVEPGKNRSRVCTLYQTSRRILCKLCYSVKGTMLPMLRWPRRWPESPFGRSCERCGSLLSLSGGYRCGISEACEKGKLCGAGNASMSTIGTNKTYR